MTVEALMAKMRSERRILLLLSLLALLSLPAGLAWPYAAVGWLLAILGVLSRRSDPPPEAAAPQGPGEERGTDIMPGLSVALETLDMPVLMLRSDETVVFQNHAARDLLGHLPVGAHVSARLRSPGVLDMVRETMETGEPKQIEHVERQPERIFAIRISPVKAEIAGKAAAGDCLYMLWFRDITDLRRIDRMRSDFVANASHELRTPLASLRGFIETLQGPARSDPAAQERFLSIMLDQATRMSRLVDDLLSLSRLEIKSHIPPEQAVDLKPLLVNVRETLLPLAETLGVEIRMHLPEGAVDVPGDRDELVQVFENLIENACKYGQDGKVVDVGLSDGLSGPVEVSVSDRGPGIPPEHVPRLTERFYRVDVADSISKKGTGLGLAIVKHILTRHGARLIVRSQIGRGSEFVVRF